MGGGIRYYFIGAIIDLNDLTISNQTSKSNQAFCLLTSLVNMKVYDEHGQFTGKFQEAQRNIAWFDLSCEGVEQGPMTQSAGERTNGDRERNEDAFSEDSDAYDEDGDAYDEDGNSNGEDEDPSNEDDGERPAQRIFTGEDGLLYTLDRPQTPLV